MAESGYVHQVLVKLLDGKHRTLNFSTKSVPIQTLKQKIRTLTQIPSHLQLLLSSNSLSPLQDHQTLDLKNGSGHGPGYFPVVVHLLLRLRGGKGGFGSLLRGAPTKAGQKKTKNFDACRDMSGRRLRHVNAEKKLEEWKAEVEERKLEKIAEDYIRKNSKEMVKKGSGSKSRDADKYVSKYREDSARCMKEVENSVKESLKGYLVSKRKGSNLNESDSKKLKIWMGKRKMDDSDSGSEDSGESGDEEEGEDKVPVVIDNGNSSDLSEEANGSQDSVTDRAIGGGSFNEEKVKSVEDGPEDCVIAEMKTDHDESQDMSGLTMGQDQDHEKELQIGGTSSDDTYKPDNEASCSNPESADAQSILNSAPVHNGSSTSDLSSDSSPKPGVQETEVPVNAPDMDTPLNFDVINSAAELEVLGMDRLKSELQARGLKCGGTLQERAARLFLLKATPLEKLPKKLLAKK